MRAHNTSSYPMWSKVTAFFAAVCFSFTTVAWSSPVQPTVREIQLPSLAERIEIPESFGSIKETFKPLLADAAQGLQSEAPVVVHIQDAHANYEAQTNIKKILEHLTQEYGFKLMLVEGGVGPVNPRLLQFFKSPGLNVKTAEQLAKDGIVSGTELFLLEQLQVGEAAAASVEAVGVEDPELFKQNLEAFRENLKRQERIQPLWDELKSAILTAGSRHFNKKLKTFFDEWIFYQDLPSEVLSHLRVLQSYALSELRLDFSNPREQLDWPQLVRIAKIKNLELKLNPDQARAERLKLAEWIRGVKGPDEFRTFLNDFDNPDSIRKEIRSYFERFYDVLRPAGFSFENYPELTRQIGLMILNEELDSQVLFAEMNRLSERLLDHLTKSNKEKQLVSLYKDWQRLKRLFALELVREDFNLISNRREALRPSKWLRRFEALNAADVKVCKSYPSCARQFDSLYFNALDFYRGAERREESIFQNMIRGMREKKVPNAILITGGFHSEGLLQRMKERGIAYVEVTPHIKEFAEDGNYKRIMSLEGDLLTLRSHIPFAPWTSPPLEADLYSDEVDDYLAGEVLASVTDRIRTEGPALTDAAYYEKAFTDLNGSYGFKKSGLSLQPIWGKGRALMLKNKGAAARPVLYLGKILGVTFDGRITTFQPTLRSEVRNDQAVIQGIENRPKLRAEVRNHHLSEDELTRLADEDERVVEGDKVTFNSDRKRDDDRIRSQVKQIETALGNIAKADEKVGEVLQFINKNEEKNFKGEEVHILNGTGREAEVIGRIDRNIAEEFGYIHETANIILLAPDGSVILQLRNKKKGKYDDHLAMYGGHLEVGQSHKESALTETKQEAGIEEFQNPQIFVGYESYDKKPLDNNRERRSWFLQLLTKEEWEIMKQKKAEEEKAAVTSHLDDRATYKKKLSQLWGEGKGEVTGFYTFTFDQITSASQKINPESKLSDKSNRFLTVSDTFKGVTVPTNAFFTPDALDRLVKSPELWSRVQELARAEVSKVEAQKHFANILANRRGKLEKKIKELEEAILWLKRQKDPAFEKEAANLEKRKTKLESRLKDISPRSEVRAALVPVDYQQKSPYDFLIDKLQFEKLELPQEKKRRPIINAFDSVHMDEFPDLFADLWKQWPEGDVAKPQAIILERYMGIGGFDFLNKNVNPEFLRILDRHGITIQTLMQGRHRDASPILLPVPFVDPQILNSIDPFKEQPRNKILRRMGKSLQMLFPENQRQKFFDLYRRILALHDREGPSSMVWLYSSDYGSIRVLETLLQGMEQALRVSPDLFKEKNLVLFTHLTRGKKYTQSNPYTHKKEEFFYHDQLLDYLHNLHDGERLLFYDFQNPLASFSPLDSGKSKIYVINLPSGFSGFDTMQNVSDLAIIAGDMGFRQMFALPGTEIGPVFLPYPHPHGQTDMRNQFLELLKQNSEKTFKSVTPSVKDLMRLFEHFLEIQDINFTPGRKYTSELIGRISDILTDRKKGRRYRDAEKLLLPGAGNAFNSLLKLLGELERGRTVADINADPATLFPEPAFEISPQRGLFKRNFLALTLLNFTVGFGDATFTQQLLQTVNAAGGKAYDDVVILLLDKNVEALVTGLLKLEQMSNGRGIDLDRLRFLIPYKGEDGKQRLHFLRRRKDAEPLSELVKRLSPPDARSEVRNEPANPLSGRRILRDMLLEARLNLERRKGESLYSLMEVVPSLMRGPEEDKATSALSDYSDLHHLAVLAEKDPQVKKALENITREWELPLLLVDLQNKLYSGILKKHAEWDTFPPLDIHTHSETSDQQFRVETLFDPLPEILEMTFVDKIKKTGTTVLYVGGIFDEFFEVTRSGDYPVVEAFVEPARNFLIKGFVEILETDILPLLNAGKISSYAGLSKIYARIKHRPSEAEGQTGKPRSEMRMLMIPRREAEHVAIDENIQVIVREIQEDGILLEILDPAKKIKNIFDPLTDPAVAGMSEHVRFGEKNENFTRVKVDYGSTVALSLASRPDEKLSIAVIKHSARSQARLGIVAPGGIPIQRGEVQDQLDRLRLKKAIEEFVKNAKVAASQLNSQKETEIAEALGRIDGIVEEFKRISGLLLEKMLKESQRHDTKEVEALLDDLDSILLIEKQLNQAFQSGTQVAWRHHGSELENTISSSQRKMLETSSVRFAIADIASKAQAHFAVKGDAFAQILDLRVKNILVRSEVRSEAGEAKFVALAEAAVKQGLLSPAALENIRSWVRPAYRRVHTQLTQEFQRAAQERDPKKQKELWTELDNAWYTKAVPGTAGMRGKLGLGTNRMSEYTLGLFQLSHALAVASPEYNKIVEQQDPDFDPSVERKAVVLGGDSRHQSYDPAAKMPGKLIKLEALLNVVNGTRAYVYRVPVSTPQVAWSVHGLDIRPVIYRLLEWLADSRWAGWFANILLTAYLLFIKVDRIVSGSMNTASHNPRTDNGNKPYKPDGSQSTGEFAALLNKKLAEATPELLDRLEYDGLGILDHVDLAFERALAKGDIQWVGGDNDSFLADEQFMKLELEEAIFTQGRIFDPDQVALQDIKIVISPLYGVSRHILEKMLRLRGLRDDQIVWVESEPNPDFPGIKGGKPNPEEPQARSQAFVKSHQVNADLILWTDPDADRPAVAFKTAPGDYLSLNGNQQLALITDYLIRELRVLAKKERAAEDPGKSALARQAVNIVNHLDRAFMASTVVSGDLMKVIARNAGLEVVETLTGFKYIGDEIEKRAKTIQQAAKVSEREWRELSKEEKIRLSLQFSELFLFGGEESLGSLTSDGPHDKDAIAGVMWFVEIAGRLRKQGILLSERLNEIYRTYGYFAEGFPLLTLGKEYGQGDKKRTFSEAEAMQIIKAQDDKPSILGRLRKEPPQEITGKKVIAILDFDTQRAVDGEGHLLFDVNSQAGLVTPHTEGIPESFSKALSRIPVPENSTINLERKHLLQGIYSFRHQGVRQSTGFFKNWEALPRENFVTLLLEDGSKVIARPSGTEPVIKFYINARTVLKDGEDTEAGKKSVDDWIKQTQELLIAFAADAAEKRFPRSEVRNEDQNEKAIQAVLKELKENPTIAIRRILKALPDLILLTKDPSSTLGDPRAVAFSEEVIQKHIPSGQNRQVFISEIQKRLKEDIEPSRAEVRAQEERRETKPNVPETDQSESEIARNLQTILERTLNTIEQEKWGEVRAELGIFLKDLEVSEDQKTSLVMDRLNALRLFYFLSLVRTAAPEGGFEILEEAPLYEGLKLADELKKATPPLPPALQSFLYAEDAYIMGILERNGLVAPSFSRPTILDPRVPDGHRWGLLTMLEVNQSRSWSSKKLPPEESIKHMAHAMAYWLLMLASSEDSFHPQWGHRSWIESLLPSLNFFQRGSQEVEFIPVDQSFTVLEKMLERVGPIPNSLSEKIREGSNPELVNLAAISSKLMAEIARELNLPDAERMFSVFALNLTIPLGIGYPSYQIWWPPHLPRSEVRGFDVTKRGEVEVVLFKRTEDHALYTERFEKKLGYKKVRIASNLAEAAEMLQQGAHLFILPYSISEEESAGLMKTLGALSNEKRPHILVVWAYLLPVHPFRNVIGQSTALAKQLARKTTPYEISQLQEEEFQSSIEKLESRIAEEFPYFAHAVEANSEEFESAGSYVEFHADGKIVLPPGSANNDLLKSASAGPVLSGLWESMYGQKGAGTVAAKGNTKTSQEPRQPPRKIKRSGPRRNKYLTEDSVRKELAAREERQWPNNPGALQTGEHKDPALYQAARRFNVPLPKARDTRSEVRMTRREFLRTAGQKTLGVLGASAGLGLSQALSQEAEKSVEVLANAKFEGADLLKINSKFEKGILTLPAAEGYVATDHEIVDLEKSPVINLKVKTQAQGRIFIQIKNTDGALVTAAGTAVVIPNTQGKEITISFSLAKQGIQTQNKKAKVLTFSDSETAMTLSSVSYSAKPLADDGELGFDGRRFIKGGVLPKAEELDDVVRRVNFVDNSSGLTYEHGAATLKLSSSQGWIQGALPTKPDLKKNRFLVIDYRSKGKGYVKLELKNSKDQHLVNKDKEGKELLDELHKLPLDLPDTKGEYKTIVIDLENHVVAKDLKDQTIEDFAAVRIAFSDPDGEFDFRSIRIQTAKPRSEVRMLVLSRKVGEVVRIRDDIKVSVLEIRNNSVSLGIEAPNIEITRPDSKKKEGPPLTGQEGMLVLSRKVNQTIQIGRNITVMVVDIQNEKVRLGFTAPADIPIHRSEVYDAIQRKQAKQTPHVEERNVKGLVNLRGDLQEYSSRDREREMAGRITPEIREREALRSEIQLHLAHLQLKAQQQLPLEARDAFLTLTKYSERVARLSGNAEPVLSAAIEQLNEQLFGLDYEMLKLALKGLREVEGVPGSSEGERVVQGKTKVGGIKQQIIVTDSGNEITVRQIVPTRDWKFDEVSRYRDQKHIEEIRRIVDFGKAPEGRAEVRSASPRLRRPEGSPTKRQRSRAEVRIELEQMNAGALDDLIIQDIRSQSDETARMKLENPNAETKLKYSFYEVPNRRLAKGKFSIQLNPNRQGRRPSQYEEGKGIQQSFNPDKFNYNKIKDYELIEEIKARDLNASIIINVNPFAEGHFLIVPERSEKLRQYLDKKEYLELVFSILKKSNRSNLKLTYNSLGAFGSINHLHFQGFYYGGDQNDPASWWNQGKLPVETSSRQIVFSQEGVEVSRVTGYPAHALAFKSTDIAALSRKVFDFVNLLNQSNLKEGDTVRAGIPYNILFTKEEVIVFPRKYEFANSFGAGTAILEMSGEFIIFDQQTADQVTEEKINDELAQTTLPETEFNVTIAELKKGSPRAEVRSEVRTKRSSPLGGSNTGKNLGTGRSEVRMLVLSRGVGESVMIRDNIKVTVLEVRRNRVSLGILAPGEEISRPDAIRKEGRPLTGQGGMLILTRKKDEIIKIGEDIQVTVIEIGRGDKVRLGFTAPENVPVHRQEIFVKAEFPKLLAAMGPTFPVAGALLNEAKAMIEAGNPQGAMGPIQKAIDAFDRHPSRDTFAPHIRKLESFLNVLGRSEVRVIAADIVSGPLPLFLIASAGFVGVVIIQSIRYRRLVDNLQQYAEGQYFENDPERINQKNWQRILKGTTYTEFRPWSGRKGPDIEIPTETAELAYRALEAFLAAIAESPTPERVKLLDTYQIRKDNEYEIEYDNTAYNKVHDLMDELSRHPDESIQAAVKELVRSPDSQFYPSRSEVRSEVRTSDTGKNLGTGSSSVRAVVNHEEILERLDETVIKQKSFTRRSEIRSFPEPSEEGYQELTALKSLKEAQEKKVQSSSFASKYPQAVPQVNAEVEALYDTAVILWNKWKDSPNAGKGEWMRMLKDYINGVAAPVLQEEDPRNISIILRSHAAKNVGQFIKMVSSDMPDFMLKTILALAIQKQSEWMSDPGLFRPGRSEIRSDSEIPYAFVRNHLKQVRAMLSEEIPISESKQILNFPRSEVRGDTPEKLQFEKDRAQAVLEEAFEALGAKGYGDLADLVKALYDAALPYFIEGRKTSPVHHIAYVVKFMTQIMLVMLGETVADPVKLKRGIVAALLHDVGLAEAGDGKIRKSDIEAILEKEWERIKKQESDSDKQKNEMKKVIDQEIKKAIDSRQEHMIAGSRIANELLLDPKFEKFFSKEKGENDIEAIRHLIEIHDNASIQEYEMLREEWYKKIGLVGEFERKLWLYDVNDELMKYLREADRLWMVTEDGIEVDLDRDSKDPTKVDIIKRIKGNIERHKEEVGLHVKVLKEDEVKQYGFYDGYLYRTATGYRIFRESIARLEDIIKEIKRRPIGELPISESLKNRLKGIPIHTVGDLIEHSAFKLKRDYRFTDENLEEVRSSLLQLRVRLKDQQMEKYGDRVNIYLDRDAMGKAAAELGIKKIKELLKARENEPDEKDRKVRSVFAAAPSQVELDKWLVELSRGEFDWRRIEIFHMDEFAGYTEDSQPINGQDPPSFRYWLNKNLIKPIVEKHGIPREELDIHFIPANSRDRDALQKAAKVYGDLLGEKPVDIVFGGYGYNGHVAFNDPPADFTTPDKVIVVNPATDPVNKKQQMDDYGEFFKSEEDIPLAVTISMPAMKDAKFLIMSVPGQFKADAIKAIHGLTDQGEVPAPDPMIPGTYFNTLPADRIQVFTDIDGASLLAARAEVRADEALVRNKLENLVQKLKRPDIRILELPNVYPHEKRYEVQNGEYRSRVVVSQNSDLSPVKIEVDHLEFAGERAAWGIQNKGWIKSPALTAEGININDFPDAKQQPFRELFTQIAALLPKPDTLGESSVRSEVRQFEIEIDSSKAAKGMTVEQYLRQAFGTLDNIAELEIQLILKEGGIRAGSFAQVRNYPIDKLSGLRGISPVNRFDGGSARSDVRGVDRKEYGEVLDLFDQKKDIDINWSKLEKEFSSSQLSDLMIYVKSKAETSNAEDRAFFWQSYTRLQSLVGSRAEVRNDENDKAVIEGIKDWLKNHPKYNIRSLVAAVFEDWIDQAEGRGGTVTVPLVSPFETSKTAAAAMAFIKDGLLKEVKGFDPSNLKLLKALVHHLKQPKSRAEVRASQPQKFVLDESELKLMLEELKSIVKDWRNIGESRILIPWDLMASTHLVEGRYQDARLDLIEWRHRLIAREGAIADDKKEIFQKLVSNLERIINKLPRAEVRATADKREGIKKETTESTNEFSGFLSDTALNMRTKLIPSRIIPQSVTKVNNAEGVGVEPISPRAEVRSDAGIEAEPLRGEVLTEEFRKRTIDLLYIEEDYRAKLTDDFAVLFKTDPLLSRGNFYVYSIHQHNLAYLGGVLHNYPGDPPLYELVNNENKDKIRFGLYELHGQVRLVTLFPTQDLSKELLVVTSVTKEKTQPITFELDEELNNFYKAGQPRFSLGVKMDTQTKSMRATDFMIFPNSLQIDKGAKTLTVEIAGAGKRTFSLVDGNLVRSEVRVPDQRLAEAIEILRDVEEKHPFEEDIKVAFDEVLARTEGFIRGNELRYAIREVERMLKYLLDYSDFDQESEIVLDLFRVRAVLNRLLPLIKQPSKPGWIRGNARLVVLSLSVGILVSLVSAGILIPFKAKQPAVQTAKSKVGIRELIEAYQTMDEIGSRNDLEELLKEKDASRVVESLEEAFTEKARLIHEKRNRLLDPKMKARPEAKEIEKAIETERKQMRKIVSLALIFKDLILPWLEKAVNSPEIAVRSEIIPILSELAAFGEAKEKQKAVELLIKLSNDSDLSVQLEAKKSLRSEVRKKSVFRGGKSLLGILKQNFGYPADTLEPLVKVAYAAEQTISPKYAEYDRGLAEKLIKLVVPEIEIRTPAEGGSSAVRSRILDEMDFLNALFTNGDLRQQLGLPNSTPAGNGKVLLTTSGEWKGKFPVLLAALPLFAAFYGGNLKNAPFKFAGDPTHTKDLKDKILNAKNNLSAKERAGISGIFDFDSAANFNEAVMREQVRTHQAAGLVALVGKEETDALASPVLAAIENPADYVDRALPLADQAVSYYFRATLLHQLASEIQGRRVESEKLGRKLTDRYWKNFIAAFFQKNLPDVIVNMDDKGSFDFSLSLIHRQLEVFRHAYERLRTAA